MAMGADTAEPAALRALSAVSIPDSTGPAAAVSDGSDVGCCVAREKRSVLVEAKPFPFEWGAGASAGVSVADGSASVLAVVDLGWFPVADNASGSIPGS